jgi:hypothetical protein
LMGNPMDMMGNLRQPAQLLREVGTTLSTRWNADSSAQRMTSSRCGTQRAEDRHLW